MARAYVIRARTDLPAGAVQILDLQPNTSQANGTLQPVGQTSYCPPLYQSDTVATTSPGGGGGSSVDTNAAYNGLAAYLIDNVADAGAGNPAITAAVANASAAFIFSNYVQAGGAGAPSDLTATEFNNALVANGTSNATAGTEIANNGGTGSVEDILRILAGEVYTVPSGSEVTDAAGAKASAAGAFDDDASEARGQRKLYLTGALQISAGAGHLSVLSDDNAFSYDGTTGAAVRVVDAAGARIS